MSYWWLVMVLYLLCGTLALFIGPLSRNLREERTRTEIQMAIHGGERWRLHGFMLVISIAGALFWPLLVWSLGTAERGGARALEGDASTSDQAWDSQSNMGGAGDITCRDCGHSEEYVSLIHGHGADQWSVTGYQCQACGRLLAVKSGNSARCECGGPVRRDVRIFCPKCRSSRVVYEMRYIT